MDYINSICALALIVVITSCATGNHLVFVKAKPTPTEVTVTKPSPLPTLALLILPAPASPVLSPTPLVIHQAPAPHTPGIAVAHIHKAVISIAAHMQPSTYADETDIDTGAGRMSFLLIIIGGPMQFFWVAGLIGAIFAVMGIILFAFGVVYLV